MGIEVSRTTGGIRVALTGLHAALCLRRSFGAPAGQILGITRARRETLEARLDHRVCGLGGHFGTRRPGRRRIGVFMGRDAGGGRQFWAVGPMDRELTVVELTGEGPLARLVLGPSIEGVRDLG